MIKINSRFVMNISKTKRDNSIIRLNNGEKSLGDQIRILLKHYQQEDAVGLPADLVADPRDVPDFKQSILMNEIQFTEVKIYGLSKLQIADVRSELASMQAFITLVIDNSQIHGLYEQQCVWFCLGGKNNFMLDLSNITIHGSAKLKVCSNAKLCIEHVDVDLAIGRIDKNFENLNGLGSLVESTIDGTFIFQVMKPMIRNEVNTNVRDQVNKKLEKLPNFFPNSISPFDMAIVGVRQQIREMRLDPFNIEDYSRDFGIFSVTSSDTCIFGLSSFYRSDNITLEMKNNTVFAELSIATDKIEGETQWNIRVIGGFLNKPGGLSFSIEYLSINVKISQSLDTTKKLTLEEIHFELGNIKIKVNGITGTMGYFMDAALNIFPNLLRYQVLEAMEEPLRQRIQLELDKINVQQMIETNIPEIEKQAKILEDIFKDDSKIERTS